MYDLRYALRSLLRAPGYAAAAIVTLAIAIGANTAMFSILHGIILEPLAIADPDRVVRVFETDRNAGSTREAASYPDFEDWRREQRVFSAIAGMTVRRANITAANSDPERLTGIAVTHEFFPLVGVQPLSGRPFTSVDDQPGAAPVVILNESVVRLRYGGKAPEAVTLDGTAYQVVGVMPSSLALARGPAPDFWIPLALHNTQFRNVRGVHDISVIGRLRDGVTVQQASSAMNLIAARLEKQYPDDNSGRGVYIEPALDFVVHETRTRLWILSAAVLAVLLIACINVAGLMLARGDVRARELAIRASIGASRPRLVRQLLTESLTIGIVGGVAGVALAFWLTRTLLALAPTLPRAQNVTMNTTVLLFAVAASVVSSIIFGIIPAVRQSSVRPATILAGSRGVLRATGTAGRGVLVMTEVALAVVLVIGAGLLLRSFDRLTNVDLGMKSGRTVTFSLELPRTKYPMPPREKYPEWPEVTRFLEASTERIGALPGVESYGFAMNHPLDDGFTSQTTVVGSQKKEGPPDELRIRPVTPGYVETLGLTLLRGRAIERSDRPGSPPVVMINRALATRYFGDSDPIGRQLEFWGTPRTIVGVIDGERFGGPASDHEPALYPPLMQLPMSALTLVVRTQGNPDRIIPAVRTAMRSVDPDVALFDIDSLDASIDRSMATPRFQAVLITAFSVIALLLAAIGLYALIAYQVQQRTNEIGIRIALGATREEVARMVLGRAAKLALGGIVVGLGGALATRRFLEALLFQISSTDPAVYVAVPLLLGGVVLVASYIPARRAMGVDPAVALRSE